MPALTRCPPWFFSMPGSYRKRKTGWSSLKRDVYEIDPRASTNRFLIKIYKNYCNYRVNDAYFAYDFYFEKKDSSDSCQNAQKTLSH